MTLKVIKPALLFCVALWSLVFVEEGHCQPPQFVGTRAEAIDAFLNPGLDKDQRLIAGSVLRFPSEQESTRLLTLITDSSQDEDLRRTAIAAHGPNFSVIQPCLDILADPDDGSAAFNAWLVDHVNSTFRFPLESKTRQDVVSRFRKLLEDDRGEVRHLAFEALLAVNDEVALKYVADGFTDEANAKLPAQQAIQYLYRADPRQHAPLIRPLISHGDEAVRAEAIKALGFDGQSRQAIVGLLGDQQTPEKIQVAALEALAVGGAAELPDNAIKIIRDRQRKPEVRAEALRWMSIFVKGGPEHVQAEQQVDFARACEEVAADEGAPEQLKQNALQQFRSSRQLESVKDFYRKGDGARTDRPDTDSLLAAIKDDQRDTAERKQLLNALVKDLASKKLSDGETGCKQSNCVCVGTEFFHQIRQHREQQSSSGDLNDDS